MGGFSLSEILLVSVPRIPFAKPPLTVSDQLQLLLDRGLIVANPDLTAHYLAHVGYYRLSGYMLPFQKGGMGEDRHHFKDGVTFEDVLDRYIFDRNLRLVVMDAIERIEISVRAILSNEVATPHGSHWYKNKSLFDTKINHDDLILEIKRQIYHDNVNQKKRDTHIKHYYNKYDSPDMPPCWMVFESISFGPVSRVVGDMLPSVAKPICTHFEVNHMTLRSWLHSVSYIRNICAHHSRLWNRECRIKPLIAKSFKSEFQSNGLLYDQLVVMQILLKKITPESHWAKKINSLIQEHPKIHSREMGFPDNWKSRNIWGLMD